MKDYIRNITAVHFVSYIAYAFGIGIILACLAYRILPSHDIQISLILIFTLATLNKSKIKLAIIDWIPFMIFLASYYIIPSIMLEFDLKTHSMGVIQFEKNVFGGTLPTIWLQNMFYNGTLRLHDYVAFFIYVSYLPLPVVLSFFIWKKDRKKFHFCVLHYIVIGFMGLTTYALYPLVPPWLASINGDIPQHVTKINLLIFEQFVIQGGSFFYGTLKPNLVAAMPSMHVAIPWVYFFFYYLYVRKKYALPLLIYCLLMVIVVVYTGEHYVIDAVVGIVYAFVCVVTLFYLRRFFYKIIPK